MKQNRLKKSFNNQDKSQLVNTKGNITLLDSDRIEKCTSCCKM